MKKIALLLVILTIPCACVPRLPTGARELAISALCKSPAISEGNTCRSVLIQRFIVRADARQDTEEADAVTRHWCVELNYVDYTGESGSAVVWLKGPNNEGEFELEEGPLFDMPCE